MGQLLSFPVEWSRFSIQINNSLQEIQDHEFQAHFPLLYDAAYIQGCDMLKPWQMSASTVLEVLKQWEIIKADLHETFSIRDQAGTVEPMKKGIGLFLELLYWCNGSPVLWKINKEVVLENKPVNWEERLDFILSYPNKYHSYIQLTELIVEMEKIFVKQQIIMNQKKRLKAD
ncbi:YpoC family protein [Niallia oryzisoli]|uniref:YpoC family protein n=1 Tax=Niallia oryzisoli TaxID=1737571 RepID=UPI0037370D0E